MATKKLKDVAKEIAALKQPVSVGDIEKVLADHCKLKDIVKRCPFCGEKPEELDGYVECKTLSCVVRNRPAKVDDWNHRANAAGRPRKG